MEKSQNPIFFSCEKCQYTTRSKKDYSKHILTAKHKKDTEISKIPNDDKFICDGCGKMYYYNSGIWRHKQQCTIFNNNNNNTQLENSSELLKEIKELKNIVEELKKTGINNQTINNNTQNNNTQNNHFNLQVYLNEKCNNAMNIDDFMKSITLTADNVLEIGVIGYHKAISNTFVKHIQKLNQFERPIQTTDLKRKLSWIKNKNNEWIKDEDLQLVNKFILLIGDKYFREHTKYNSTIKEWKDHQSKVHDKSMVSLGEILKAVTSDDKNNDYSKIHKTINENTLVQRSKELLNA